MKLVFNEYGKARVRIAKVVRAADAHHYLNFTVNISLQGDLETSYTAGDNRNVLPTDTMKNSVYALAAQNDFTTIEQFGLLLAQRFMDRVDHLTSAKIELEGERWRRVDTSAGPHPHAFIGGQAEKMTAAIVHTRDGVDIKSGLKDLFLVKTTESAFVGFFKEEYTILPEETDRIMGTCLASWWRFNQGAHRDYAGMRENVREIILTTFASHNSQSVQHTLFEIGTNVLTQCDPLLEIYLSMPNVHNIPFDFSRLGIESHNVVFVPIDEPHGSIAGIIRRE